MIPQMPISLPFPPFPAARMLDGTLNAEQSKAFVCMRPNPRPTNYITHRDARLAEKPEEGFSETAWKDTDVKVLS
jgi:hypothetical protein